MKTGFDLRNSTENQLNDYQLDFMRKSVAIMKVLTEESLKTAERFTKACGRTMVTATDMQYALMFEAHEFFDKDIDQRFYRALSEEREHDYDTEEEDEEEDDESELETEPDEEHSTQCKLENEKYFHAQVMKYVKDWEQWHPQDPVKRLIKSSIDKTRA